MNNVSYACFSEGKIYLADNYHNIVGNVQDSLLLTIMPGGRFKFNVTGFLIVNNIVVVVFPKNYNLPTSFEEIKSESKILLKVLLRYRQEQGISEEENLLLSGSKVNANGRICAGFELLEDYRENGYIEKRNSVEKVSNNGFINWQRTINKTTPIIGHGRPIYDKLIIRNQHIDRYNIIRLLHEYVISECMKLWGWLLGYEEMEYSKPLPCSIKEASSILNEELVCVYNEREKRVLQNMISFFESLGGTKEEKKQELLVTPYFYWVWEAICGYVFKNDYERLKSVVPKPIWESSIIKSNLDQRPDILTIEQDVLYIWDAKYYDYSEGRIPGWHDIVKQLFYKYTIEQKVYGDKIGIKDIKNAFLLPESKEEDYRYLGYVHVSEVEQLGRIYTYALNVKKMLKSYAGQKATNISEKVLQDLKDK